MKKQEDYLAKMGDAEKYYNKSVNAYRNNNITKAKQMIRRAIKISDNMKYRNFLNKL